jgi:hypothetical protein
MLLKFKKSNKWSAGIGVPDIEVEAGIPVEVNEFTAKIALDSDSAEQVKIQSKPEKKDKRKAEGSPAKKDKKKAEKK